MPRIPPFMPPIPWEELPSIKKEYFGFHVNPGSLAYAPQDWPDLPKEEDFRKISEIASFVVMNIWRLWWNNPIWRPHVEQQLRWMKKYNLTLIARVDDPSLTRDWPIGPGKHYLSWDWFLNVHTPFLKDLFFFLKSIGMEEQTIIQHQNECFHDEAMILVTGGYEITPEVYMDYIHEDRELIRALSPETKFTMNAIATFVETRKYALLWKLVSRKVLEKTDYANLHCYKNRWSRTAYAFMKRAAEWLGDKPVVFSEINHSNKNANPKSKLRAIKTMYKYFTEFFNVKAFCAFAYNADAHLEAWRIKETELYEMLREDIVV